MSFNFLAYRRNLHCAILLIFTGVHSAATSAAADDGMDFPRSALNWYMSGDAEQLWPHISPMLREMAEDEEGLREVAADIEETMGRELAVLGEQIFDHPDGGGWQVYVRTVQHADVGEMFWVVIFLPEQNEVGMIITQPRQTIQTFFPQVRLP
jgi:hypothetical protein